MFPEDLVCARPRSWPTWSSRFGICGPGFIQQTLNRWFPYVELKAALVGEKGDLGPLPASDELGRVSYCRQWKVGWGARGKGLCFRQDRELHYESPEAEISRHLQGLERSSVGWAGASSERETGGGGQRRGCRPQITQGLERQARPAQSAQVGSQGRALKGKAPSLPLCGEWPGSRGPTRTVQL